MLLDNLAIRTKALIPVVVMALMVLMIVGVGAYQTAMLGAAGKDMTVRQDRGLVAILTATRQVNRLKLTVFQSLIYDGSDISGSEKEKTAFADAHTRADALLAEAVRLLPTHAPQISDFAKQFDGIVESAESPFNVALDTPGLSKGRDTSPEDLDKLSEGARQLYHVDNALDSADQRHDRPGRYAVRGESVCRKRARGPGALGSRPTRDGRILPRLWWRARYRSGLRLERLPCRYLNLRTE